MAAVEPWCGKDDQHSRDESCAVDSQPTSAGDGTDPDDFCGEGYWVDCDETECVYPKETGNCETPELEKTSIHVNSEIMGLLI